MNTTVTPTHLPPAALPSHELTGVELEMLLRAAAGDTNKEIALAMHTSEQTVKNRWRSVCVKTRARNRTQAVAEAVRQGWIS